MILVLCIDDCLGMCFGGRRQSRDSAVYADLAHMAGDAPIWMAERSAPLFADTNGSIRACPDFVEKAGKGEYCFVEFTPPSALEGRAEKIILYRWNRRYPSDLKFDISLEGWKLEHSFDFPGSSHETISKEVYTRD